MNGRSATEQELQSLKDKLSEPKRKKSLFLSLDKIAEWEQFFHYVPKEIRDMVLERNKLRLQRLFTEADALKAEIWARGWGCRDSEGTVIVYLRRYWTESIK